jgi:hypothetical protein
MFHSFRGGTLCVTKYLRTDTESHRGSQRKEKGITFSGNQLHI